MFISIFCAKAKVDLLLECVLSERLVHYDGEVNLNSEFEYLASFTNLTLHSIMIFNKQILRFMQNQEFLALSLPIILETLSNNS